MSRIPIVLLSLVLLVSPTMSEDEAARPLLSLRDAVASGKLAVCGTEPGSYRAVTLEVRNRTEEAIEVDLCGSFLRPKKRGSCQRLGLGPAITPRSTKKKGKGTIVLELAPKESKSLRLQTVCLDAGRSGPDNQEFDVAPTVLPPVREKVLRWWADNPGAPQSSVNSAIWRFQERVHIGPGIAADYRTPSGYHAASYGGTYYRLASGELTSIDPDGVRRILGTEIFSVFPTAGGVYAVALGETGGPELWRLAMTGEEPWGKVAELSTTGRVLGVVPMDGRIAVVTDWGVRIVNAEGATSEALSGQQKTGISATKLDGRHLLVAMTVPSQRGYYQGGERKGETSDLFELWKVDTKTGKSEFVKKYWNVRAVSVGPAGTFGLTHRGLLRRLAGTQFKTLPNPESFARFVAVGKKLVWLLREDGILVAVDSRTGALRCETKFRPESLFHAVVDPVTDDLVSTWGSEFWRIRDVGGKREKVGETQPGR